jgi:hypothetical protein
MFRFASVTSDMGIGASLTLSHMKTMTVYVPASLDPARVRSLLVVSIISV